MFVFLYIKLKIISKINSKYKKYTSLYQKNIMIHSLFYKNKNFSIERKPKKFNKDNECKNFLKILSSILRGFHQFFF